MPRKEKVISSPKEMPEIKEAITVTKEVTFDCAHMLSGYDGLCSNLHGHTYKLQLTFQGFLIEKGPKEGMVIDFKDIKEIIQKVIMSKFDHALIFSGSALRDFAEDALLEWAIAYNKKAIVIPCRTTAEEMVLYIQKIVEEEVEKAGYDNIFFTHIRLYETPTSFAEV